MVLEEMWMQNLIETGKSNIENITSIRMKQVNRQMQTLINNASKLLLTRDQFHILLEPFVVQPITLVVGSGSNFKVPLKGNKIPLRLNFKYEIIEPDSVAGPINPENEFSNIFEFYFSTNHFEPNREHH